MAAVRDAMNGEVILKDLSRNLFFDFPTSLFPFPFLVTTFDSLEY